MITHLDTSQQRHARRQLLADIVYILCHDTLSQMRDSGLTALSPAELFLSAQNFCQIVRQLPDPLEGLDDEIADLREEAGNETDTALIMTLAAVQMQALNKHQADSNTTQAIMHILARLDGNPQAEQLILSMAIKERDRYLQNKRTNLLDYELRQIEAEGGGSEAVRHLFKAFISYAQQYSDPQNLKEMLLFLNQYNNDHNHAYDKEIQALYDTLGIKNTPTTTINGDVVGVKNVKNEIGNVEPGGTGFTKQYHKE